MSKSIRIAVAALALGVLCTQLGGCVSDLGTTLSNVSQASGDVPPLRYYGGPKYPMWPDR